MNNMYSLLLANVYSGFSPILNTAASSCFVNGKEVACSGGFMALGIAFPAIIFLFVLVMIASMWKVFTKAGQPGWAAIVPIYNYVILLNIAKKPTWWVILLLVPFVNIIIGIIVTAGISKNFGKGIGFTLGLIVLPFIFFPILGFGDARYNAMVEAPMQTA